MTPHISATNTNLSLVSLAPTLNDHNAPVRVLLLPRGPCAAARRRAGRAGKWSWPQLRRKSAATAPPPNLTLAFSFSSACRVHAAFRPGVALLDASWRVEGRSSVKRPRALFVRVASGAFRISRSCAPSLKRLWRHASVAAPEAAVSLRSCASRRARPARNPRQILKRHRTCPRGGTSCARRRLDVVLQPVCSLHSARCSGQASRGAEADRKRAGARGGARCSPPIEINPPRGCRPWTLWRRPWRCPPGPTRARSGRA